MPENHANIKLSGPIDLISADIALIKAKLLEKSDNINLLRHVRPDNRVCSRYTCKSARKVG